MANATADYGFAFVKSMYGYIRVTRFNRLGRAGLRMAIEEGKVEIIDSPLGRAYRLRNKQDM